MRVVVAFLVVVSVVAVPDQVRGLSVSSVETGGDPATSHALIHVSGSRSGLGGPATADAAGSGTGSGLVIGRHGEPVVVTRSSDQSVPEPFGHHSREFPRRAERMSQGSSVSMSRPGDEHVATSVSIEPAPLRVLQSQTDWYINDNPTLFGPSQYWYEGNVGHGYGSNNFKYTYAIGGDTNADNWARWNMGNRVGRQTIIVYVPSNQATATVRYNIFKDDSFFAQANIAQANVSGWTTLGTWNFDNADVMITVQDNQAVQHHNTHGYAASRIAVDAIAMRCVSNCTSSASPPGQVDHTTLKYVVDDASNGAGRVVWRSILRAISYDVDLTIGTEVISDGTVGEDTHNLRSQTCCTTVMTVNQGYRITALSMRVRALNDAGTGPWSEDVLVGISYPVAPPPSVTGLSFSSGRISWNAAARATAYDVELRQDDEPNRHWAAPCCSLDITYVAHKELNYRVRAKNKNGTQFGPWSSWQTHEREEDPVQIPPAPSGVRFDSGRVTWTAASGVDSYWVALCAELGCVVEVDVSCCSYAIGDRDLADLTHVRVAAVNAAGESDWSSDVVIPRPVGEPDAPSGVSFDSGRANWNPVANADSYELLLCITHGGAPQCPQLATEIACCSNAITDRSITHFWVRAVNSAGHGSWSGPVYLPVRVPGTPSGVRVASGQVTWNSVSGADSYDVALCVANGCVVHDNIRFHAFTISDRTVTYIKVRAVNNAGQGAWSNDVPVPAVLPQQVEGAGYRASDDGPLLYWRPQANVASYEIDAREEPTDRSDYRDDIGCLENWDECGYLYRRDNLTSERFKEASHFRIRAVNEAGTGPWSSWIRVDAEPELGTIGELRYDGNSVTWDQVPGATSYLVNKKTGSFKSYSSVHCCQYSIARKQDSISTVRVRPVNVNAPHVGVWSNPLTIRALSKPTAPKISVITDIEIHIGRNPFENNFDVSVSWSRVADATSYIVQWRTLEIEDHSELGLEDISRSIKLIIDGCEPRGHLSSGTCGRNVASYAISWAKRDTDMSGKQTVGRETTVRLKNVYNEEDPDFLQFRVKAFRNTIEGEWSKWETASVGPTRDTLDDRAAIRPGRCPGDLGSDVLAGVTIFNSLPSSSLKDIAWTALKTKIGPPGVLDLLRVGINALAGCYESPLEAIEDLPVVGAIVKGFQAISKLADEIHCFYSFVERKYDIDIGLGCEA